MPGKKDDENPNLPPTRKVTWAKDEDLVKTEFIPTHDYQAKSYIYNLKQLQIFYAQIKTAGETPSLPITSELRSKCAELLADSSAQFKRFFGAYEIGENPQEFDLSKLLLHTKALIDKSTSDEDFSDDKIMDDLAKIPDLNFRLNDFKEILFKQLKSENVTFKMFLQHVFEQPNVKQIAKTSYSRFPFTRKNKPH